MTRRSEMSDFENTSLCRITQRFIDADAEIIRAYPAFKLGADAGVHYYAELLLPLAKRMIVGDSAHRDWILTAPAITDRTPAAANLLCRELFKLCKRDRDINSSKELSLIDIPQAGESPDSMDWKDPTKSLDYANLDFEDRVKERERFLRRLAPGVKFRGRPVLFVNDICVTGAQQGTMQQYFDRAGAACVRWLYIIDVDRDIGKANPKIESQINDAPFEELLRTVSCEQIQFTGKCVQKLMHLSVAKLGQVLEVLSEERRRRLLELSVRSGYETRDGFRDRVELLRMYASKKCNEN
jgi:hypothetical protein